MYSGFSSQRINLSPVTKRFLYRTRKQIDQRIKMTPTVNLHDDDLCRPSLFPEGTLVIKTWGPGAARATHVVMPRHLGALSGVPTSTLQVWSQEDPCRWYMVGPPALHGKTGQIAEPLCFFRIEELGPETTRATIHLLPPTLKYHGLKKIVNKAVGEGTFEKVPHRIDQAAVYVPREKENVIPHDVELKYEEETTFLLVTVHGRRTQCTHCGDTDHYTNRCTGAKPSRKASYAEKAKKAPPPPKAPKPTPETENEAETTWTVVGPRNKEEEARPPQPWRTHSSGRAGRKTKATTTTTRTRTTAMTPPPPTTTTTTTATTAEKTTKAITR